MGVNLTNQFIDETFQKLTQISGSGQLTDGTGSLIASLDVTASNAISASHAVNADNAANATTASHAISASYATQASASYFATTASQAIATDFANEAAYATSASHALLANTASFAVNAFLSTLATTASYVNANNVDGAVALATTASYAATASYAENALIDTGSFVVTGSVNLQTITLEKADGSSFDLTVSVSGSVESASYANVAGLAYTASYIDGANVVGPVANATDALYSQNTVTTGKNLEATEILKGTPLYFTASGTQGNLVGIYRADAGNPDRMPAGGIAGEDIATEGEGLVLLDGYIGGVNTSTFQSGDQVYVAVGGGYTNVRPTGSNNQVQFLGNIEKSAVNGSGVIQMMGESHSLPNIQQGYFWVGGAGDVPTTVTSASFAKVGENNVFTGTQTFDNISVSGTGSFAYIQSVTGSAKIIGDAFIILNNDTPAERYAGLVVQDSGSTGVTASLQFDGQLNDWFYQYSDDGGVTTDHGIVLFGPEFPTKGTPTYPTNNTLQKGNGGHHLLDSIVTDDGSKVTVAGQFQANGLTGSLQGTASYALTSAQDGQWNGTYVGDANISGSLTVTGSLNNLFDVPAFAGGPPFALPYEYLYLGSGNGNTPFGGDGGQPFFLYANNSFIPNGFRMGTRLGSTPDAVGNYMEINSIGFKGQYFPPNSGELSFFEVSNNDGPGGNTSAGRIQATNVTLGMFPVSVYTGPNPSRQTTVNVGVNQQYGPTDFYKTTFVNVNAETGSFNTDRLTFNTQKFTISDQTGMDFVSQANITFESTSDQIQFLGNSTFEGSVRNNVVAVSVASNTGSLDCSQSNFQTLSLIDGQDIRLESSNVNAGQTINLKVTQGGSGTGTLSFGPEFKFAGGSAPTITASSNAVDIITFITYTGGGDVYTSAVQNLS